MTEREAWMTVARMIFHGDHDCLCYSIHELNVQKKITGRVKGNMVRKIRRYAERRGTTGVGPGWFYGLAPVWPMGKQVPRIQFCTEQIRKLS